MNEPAPGRKGDALSWLHEQGKRRAQVAPEFDVEDTLREVRAAAQVLAPGQEQTSAAEFGKPAGTSAAGTGSGLARRLRHLRTAHWADSKLTQAALANALGKNVPLLAATVASWESRTAPKLPPRERLVAYAQFFATRRSLGPEPALVPLDSFTQGEQVAYQVLLEELLGLHSAARGNAGLEAPIAARRSWHFADSAPLTLVCAKLPEEEAEKLADQASVNYTQLVGFSDLDAMVELHGHVRAENPGIGVFYKAAPDVEADDLSGHVVIIGGIGWNDVTQRLIDLSRLPVRQEEDPAAQTGEIFLTDEEQQKYLPQWSAETGTLMEDVGLLVRMPNPLNSNRTITMCNGIHSRGVLGAVRSLTDARLRESNEQYIAQNFPDNQFGILMRVQVIEGEALTPDFSTEGTVLYQWPDKNQSGTEPGDDSVLQYPTQAEFI